MSTPIDIKEEPHNHITCKDKTCKWHFEQTSKEDCKGCKNGKREGCYTCGSSKENDWETKFYGITGYDEQLAFIRSLLQNRDREHEHKLAVMKAACEGACDQDKILLLANRDREIVNKIQHTNKLREKFLEHFRHCLFLSMN